MKNKDIDRRLRESAKNVKFKDFSERWNEIESRLTPPPEDVVREPVAETVFATSESVNISPGTFKKRIVCVVSAAFLFIVVCLAIVLPITLKKSNLPIFYDLINLRLNTVSESEFYDKIEESELKIFNSSKYNIDNYCLLYTSDNALVGGILEFMDDEWEVFSTVTFYGYNVKSFFNIGTEYNEYSTNGAEIKYTSEWTEEEDCYTVKATAKKNEINYEFDCLALSEEINGFFDKLFA